MHMPSVNEIFEDLNERFKKANTYNMNVNEIDSIATQYYSFNGINLPKFTSFSTALLNKEILMI